MSEYRYRIYAVEGNADGFVNQLRALFLLPATAPGRVVKGKGKPVQTDEYSLVLTNGTVFMVPVFADDIDTIFPGGPDPTVDESGLPAGPWYVPGSPP